MSSNLYSQTFGTTSSNSFPANAIITERSPVNTDIQGNLGAYPVGQLWVNSLDQSSWQLVSYETALGVVTANWNLLGASASGIQTLSGNTGVANPSAGNIQILGTGGITTAASGDQVTISLSSPFKR